MGVRKRCACARRACALALACALAFAAFAGRRRDGSVIGVGVDVGVGSRGRVRGGVGSGVMNDAARGAGTPQMRAEAVLRADVEDPDDDVGDDIDIDIDTDAVDESHEIDYSCAASFKARYARRGEASFAVALNVSHLDGRYWDTGGWLGQEQEDRWVYEHFFHDASAGRAVGDDLIFPSRTFVELGGLDGFRFSNTYIFEKAFKWTGLIIEGATENYVALERNRGQGDDNVVTLHAAICEPNKIIKLHGSGPSASRYAMSRKSSWAPCLAMQDVLKRVGIEAIDFLSLDVEGAELDVLKTMNFQQTPTFVILVEMRKVDEDTNPSIRKHLHREGFCLFAQDVGHSNEVWVDPKFQRDASSSISSLKEKEAAAKEEEERKSLARQCEPFLGMSASLWIRHPVTVAYSKLHCSNVSMMADERPKYQSQGQALETNDAIGATTSPCVPQITRCAREALERVMKPNMHGLEWSCSRGTPWYLQRLASLNTIEYSKDWLQRCDKHVSSMGDDVSSKWFSHFVPPVPDVEQNSTISASSHGVKKRKFDEFKDYVKFAASMRRRMFDFIAIGGESRAACLKLVLDKRLIREQDGIVVFDNTGEPREYFDAIAAVPKHWHRYAFKTDVERRADAPTTILWITQNMVPTPIST